MVAGRQSKKSFQQNRILETERYKASEWVFVAVIYNEELANAFIVLSCCQYIEYIPKLDVYSQ